MPLFRRADGDVVKDVPAYRRLMPFLMRTRNESAVYFEQRIDAEHALAFVKQWNEAHPDARITFFHVLLHECVKLLDERPRLNRFVSGGRLYQRRGVWISYSAKKSMSDDAPIVALKKQFDPAAPFEAHVRHLQAQVREGKSDRKSAVDRELELLFLLPLFMVKAVISFVKWLDSVNLLPHALRKGDPMYSSVFIANLGSIKLDAAYHHNYEYGNIPIFCTVGKVSDEVYVRPDGTIGTRKEIILRWTLDERIEDGLYCARTLDALRVRLEAPRTVAGVALTGPPVQIVRTDVAS